MQGGRPVSTFERERRRLLELAYGFLGSRAEAEDVVQDAYIRLDQADFTSIENPSGWLTTVVARLALDHLRSARVRRETYHGVWLPEPVVEAPSAEDTLLLESRLSIAFLLLLERLGPEERAIFVLREVFDHSYADISAIVNKSAAACRQVVARTRARLQREAPTRQDDPAASSSTIRSYVEALTAGDEQRLLQLLAPDAVLFSDGGGKVAAALRPVQGAAKIARLLLSLVRKYTGQFAIEQANVNGQAGLVLRLHGRKDGVWAFDVADGRIQHLYLVRNPEKLARVS